MNKIITLTTEASKRLIAKAIVQIPSVQKAFELGYIALSLGTTCGFIVEELCGYQIQRSRYCSRYISSRGPCILNPEEQIGFTLFVHGEMITAKPNKQGLDYYDSLESYLREMGSSDIFIKSGNVMDSAGEVGCLVKSRKEVEIREGSDYIPKEVYLIIPMTVNKTIPCRVRDLVEIFRNEKIKPKCNADPSDMIILNGEIITEIEAARSLFGVEMLPVAVGGVGRNRSSTTFMLYGDDHAVENAYRYLSNLRNEPELLEIENLDCQDCSEYTLPR